MTQVQQTAYIPKRLRRFNNGKGRLRPGRQADLPVANQIAIGREVNYPSLDYDPEDLVTDLGVATVTAAAADGAVAGIATVVQGAQSAVFRLDSLEFDEDSAGTLLAVESATAAFALELVAEATLTLLIDDSSENFGASAKVPLPLPAAGAGEVWLVIDLTADREGVALLYRGRTGDPLQLLTYVPTPKLALWADAAVTCAFLAAASPGIGSGAAPSGGLGTTANLSFWANTLPTGW